jgi:hypothetical protein
MWSDVETFDLSNNTSATMDRVVSQLKIEQPYVDNYVSWEYCYYDSPNNINSGFQTTYIDYLNTGSLETAPPTVPTNFTAKLLTDGDVALNWDAATDNIGVCGYYVYRNGIMIYKNQVPILMDSTSVSSAPTSYIDGGLSSNTKYEYQVRAYDFAGNISALSQTDTVTTSNFSVVSLNCKYSVSTSPSSSYPDPNGKKLTDGIFASTAYYADPAWVGFISPDTLKVTIDLGQTIAVQQFIGEYLLDPQPAVFLPSKVNVSISTDNYSFIKVGNLIDSNPNDSLASIHKYYYSLSSSVSARYIKFSTIAPGGAWVFVDEYQVLSPVVTGISKQLSSVPTQFELSNNYPNPFNPSTNIKFSLVQSGNVSLKIYNVLGELVKTLINNEYKNRGDYIYQVTMNNLASGVYFYTLTQGSQQITKKMILLK